MNYNSYYSKYIKYKTKYTQLKNQVGGTVINTLTDSISLSNFKQIKSLINGTLGEIIPTEQFIGPEEIACLINSNSNLIMLVITYYLYNIHKETNYDVFNPVTNYKNYFNKIYQLVLATKNIYIHLTKYIESNIHTVLLVPGDSPNYFLFLLKVLYPEFKSGEKLTIIEFPISGLGAIEPNEIVKFIYKKDMFYDCEILADGIKYLSFILDLNLPEQVKHNPHQFVIMDYVEAGKSIVFIDKTIKSIYKMEPYRINPDFVRVINLADYFKTSEYIIDEVSMFPKFEKKIRKELEKNPNLFNTLEGIETYDKIKLRHVFYFDKNFLDGINTGFVADYSSNVLKHIVDESGRRCQYSLKLDKATCLATGTTTMDDFLGQITKPFNIHALCNVFRVLLYLLCTEPNLNNLAEQAIGKISDKISSLIVYGVECKVVLGTKTIQGQFLPDPTKQPDSLNLTVRFETRPTNIIETINIFQIDSIELV